MQTRTSAAKRLHSEMSDTNLLTEAVHIHQCVQFFVPLFCPQLKIIHVGFESADQSPKNVHCRTGFTRANNPLGLRH